MLHRRRYPRTCPQPSVHHGTQHERGREDRYAHVDAALALEHLVRVLPLVVERDVRAKRARERDFLLRPRACDHLHACGFGELHDRAAGASV